MQSPAWLQMLLESNCGIGGTQDFEVQAKVGGDWGVCIREGIGDLGPEQGQAPAPKSCSGCKVGRQVCGPSLPGLGVGGKL